MTADLSLTKSKEVIPYCDCGLTGGCEECMPITSEGITIITETVDEILAGAFIDGGLFYLDNRDCDKDTKAFIKGGVLQLKRDLSLLGVVRKVERDDSPTLIPLVAVEPLI